jgi:hypothetical protein
MSRTSIMQVSEDRELLIGRDDLKLNRDRLMPGAPRLSQHGGVFPLSFLAKQLGSRYRVSNMM